MASILKDSRIRRSGPNDGLSWYLSSIGRIPLLTAAEEIALGHQVQRMLRLQAEVTEISVSSRHKVIRLGERAKHRMVQGNLRMVVSIAKNYQGRGVELLDLIQEGSIGLERAVEKYDPERGYKFSTYAFWWIRQSMSRAIGAQGRTIRLPFHVVDKLVELRRKTHYLSHQLGMMPSRQQLAAEMMISLEELDQLLAQSATASSLDAPIRQAEGSSNLVDLIADEHAGDPLELVESALQHEKLFSLITSLNEQQQLILNLRYGLKGQAPQTLAEIGRQLGLTRERIRQIEQRAIAKLRQQAQSSIFPRVVSACDQQL